LEALALLKVGAVLGDRNSCDGGDQEEECSDEHDGDGIKMKEDAECEEGCDIPL
jgi:hypothetical protein